jgi:cytidine deaminase
LSSDHVTVDWNRLRTDARAVAANAYAPYSHVHVGAAALVDDGRVIVGCNVENASYGLSLCAECGIASALHGSGGGRLVALTVVAGDGDFLAPCGRCRQILWEVGGPDLLIDADDEPVRLAQLLPGAFGPADLDTRSTPPAPEKD